MTPIKYLAQLGVTLAVVLAALFFSKDSSNYQELLIFVVLVGALIAIYREDILHPLVWFPTFFALYTLIFPIGVLIQVGYLDSVALQGLRISTYALAGFSMGVAIAGLRPVSLSQPPITPFISSSKTLLVGVFVFCGTFVHVLAALASGAATKRELVDTAAESGSVLLRLGPFFVLLTTIIVLYLHKQWSERRLAVGVAIFSFSWFALGMLITGQRDYFFRFIVSIFFLFHVHMRRIPASLFLGAVAVGVVMMPVTQALKGHLLGNPFLIEIGILEVLSGEFSNAGRNLYLILNSEPDRFNGQTFVWDIKRSLVLPLIGPETEGTTDWFNRRYRFEEGVSGTSGWGFNIVAEGYINFGSIGAFCTLFLMGLVSGLLYKKIPQNSYWLVGYILYISVASYSIRADFANYLSPGIRFVLIPLMIMYLLSQTRIVRSSQLMSSGRDSPRTIFK